MNINDNLLTHRFRYLMGMLALVFGIVGCEKYLDEPVYSEMDPETLLATEAGVNSLLNSTFAELFLSGWDGKSRMNLENWCTDIEWETGGGENLIATQMINFTWDASLPWFNNILWLRPYRAIRNANLLLENIDRGEYDASRKATYMAEARFMRALAYAKLYGWFGPVPLRTSSDDPLELGKASDEEMQAFIESELQSVSAGLPLPGEEANYGRPNRGAALATLCKFYLNTKQWEKVVTTADDIIALDNYRLYSEYEKLFRVENERNSEFILVFPQSPQGNGNGYINGAFPPGFQRDPVLGLEFRSGWQNWAAQYRLYDSFYNSFKASDERRKLIMTGYINGAGREISLLNNNDTRSIKYWPDPDAIVNEHGNDLPEIRFADILLAKSEALAELNWPSQEAVDLVNQVRERAGLVGDDAVSLADFSSLQAFRDHMLNERAWEFYNEVGIRREDLIRFGKFVSSAHGRGKTNARETHVLFPIPQAAMDADPSLEQNDGY
ncbi:RagB/SusD family nutrient uptake outer membrane protein [Parapedobacter tibetensis]|uniref:RagB/SusD family nutrient uptake outer membrane protein n=1 Tax=Parapedobacter tibetensis TaxID=2972951 RepID=UPI00214D8363|nr:RagB/SusD family nutrient uptake outer membrane protein [Parapedobacter tibetensis]